MSRPAISKLLSHAARRRCPCCGRGRLFDGFFSLKHRCETCDYDFDASEGSTWFFMYMTSGGVIGVCFLILFFWRPAREEMVFASSVMIGAAAVLLLGSLPWRKAVAIALDYWIEPRVRDKAND